MTGPLAGIRVIDVSQMISGPFATMILGDQGADVIKVEPTVMGDIVRYFGAMRGGMSALFATSNRNKRSVGLNLKDRKAIDILKELVSTSDVFVQNFRPGAVERMGIGEGDLRAVCPDLIYVSISGFGDKGPYASNRVYDPVIQALSGMAVVQSDSKTQRPNMVQTILPDKLTALNVAQAVCAALFLRERTGQGQHIRVAMLDTMVAWLWPDGMWNHTLLGEGVLNELPRGFFNLVFETSDGFMTVAALQDKEWQGLARACGQGDWIEDSRFRTIPDRVTHIAELRLAMENVLKGRSTKEWVAVLGKEEVPCAPILSIEEMMEDPQVRENGIILESDHPVVGRMRQPRPSAEFCETPAVLRLPAPRLGEHTEEILGELGYEMKDLEEMRDLGSIK